MEKKRVTIHQFYDELEKHLPTSEPPLIQRVFRDTKSSFLALIATILSARTADSTTEKRLPELFSKVKTPLDLENIPEQELAQILFPIGFYHTKAHHLKKLPQALHELFHDKVPETIDELIQLPGVGRKTANLIVNVCFDEPAICVDTHVHRLMNYIGYVNTKTPEETEMALRKKLPKELWKRTNHIFVILGQTICKPADVKRGGTILDNYQIVDEL